MLIVNIVALTNPIDEEMYQDYRNNMFLLPPFTGLLPYIREAVGHSCICISEACLEDLRKHAVHAEQRMKPANEKGDFRPGLLIKITVFPVEEGGHVEEIVTVGYR